MKPKYSWLLLVLVLLGCQMGDLDFYVRFGKSPGLQAEDRVLLAGRQAGRVVAVERVEDGSWWVQVQVASRFRRQVTTGSLFRVQPDPGRPGHRCLYIVPAPEGKPLRDGAVVEGTEAPADFLSPLLQNMEQALKELQRLPESPQFRQLQRQLEEIYRQMEETTRELEKRLFPRQPSPQRRHAPEPMDL